MNLLSKGDVSVKVPRSGTLASSGTLRTDVPLSKAQPPLESSSVRESPTLPQPSVPLQVFSTLFLSALLLLAVKTETFYGVYKPEVTQLNETICHIKFTSARIKCQIT